ncbi:hypothetical protein BV898_09148 [Hypsibius exemplaris]|uniref:Uncharacterized protein n=1 Tax=Hypsibius exemplaris TaxID=2072580 RepID=A0A1W0WNP1_HYPEX|nr:hypothetical protein BV898_09148 [Hypsibius exemplaris]
MGNKSSSVGVAEAKDGNNNAGDQRADAAGKAEEPAVRVPDPNGDRPDSPIDRMHKFSLHPQLGPHPVQGLCPHCGQSIITNTQHQAGEHADSMASVFCCLAHFMTGFHTQSKTADERPQYIISPDASEIISQETKNSVSEEPTGMKGPANPRQIQRKMGNTASTKTRLSLPNRPPLPRQEAVLNPKTFSVNEAGRYKNYNHVRDPMKNHEAFIETHWARLCKIHIDGGAVDCGKPDSWGKYRSKWNVIERWNAINRARDNFRYYETLCRAVTHYDHIQAQKNYMAYVRVRTAKKPLPRSRMPPVAPPTDVLCSFSVQSGPVVEFHTFAHRKPDCALSFYYYEDGNLPRSKFCVGTSRQVPDTFATEDSYASWPFGMRKITIGVGNRARMRTAVVFSLIRPDGVADHVGCSFSGNSVQFGRALNVLARAGQVVLRKGGPLKLQMIFPTSPESFRTTPLSKLEIAQLLG